MNKLFQQHEFFDRYKGLLFLFALTLALKVAMLAGTDVVSNDGPTYLNVSKQFIDGKLGFRDVFRGSLYFYPALIAALSRISPGNTVDSLINAGQLLSMLFSILSIIPFYHLVEKIWSSRSAFWAGLIFCVAPGINKYAVDVMRDPGYIFFFLTALYLGWCFVETHRFLWFLASMIAAALAFMFRVEAVLLITIIFIWSFWSFLRHGRFGSMVLRSVLIVVVVACFGGVLTWYLNSDIGSSSRYGEIAGGVSRIIKGEAFGYSPELKVILDSAGRELVGTTFGNDFFAIAKNHIRTIYLLGVFTLVVNVSWLPFFLFILAGIFQSFRNNFDKWYLFSFIVSYFLLGYFYNMQRNFLEDRYVYSVIVLLYPFAGYAITLFFDKLTKWLPLAVSWAIVFLLIAVPATANNFKYRHKWQSYPFKEAGLWLAAQQDIQQARVMANERKIPFYAGKYDGYSLMPFDVNHLPAQGIALQGYDYIAIETAPDLKDKIVALNGFRIVKQIESERYLAVVYKKVHQ